MKTASILFIDEKSSVLRLHRFLQIVQSSSQSATALNVVPRVVAMSAATNDSGSDQISLGRLVFWRLGMSRRFYFVGFVHSSLLVYALLACTMYRYVTLWRTSLIDVDGSLILLHTMCCHPTEAEWFWNSLVYDLESHLSISFDHISNMVQVQLDMRYGAIITEISHISALRLGTAYVFVVFCTVYHLFGLVISVQG